MEQNDFEFAPVTFDTVAMIPPSQLYTFLEKENAWTLKTLVKATGVDTAKISDALSELSSMGLLEFYRNSKGQEAIIESDIVFCAKSK